ncbi:MAG: hypothetical protein Q9224_000337 [Gallowayella concinna]
MAGPKVIRNPSAYAPVPFHLLRFCQLISAAVVTSIAGYFVHVLLHEHYKVPWRFIFPLAASSLTILALIVTSALYHFHTLLPTYNLISNAALSIFWLLGISFFTHNLGWKIGQRCAIAPWHTEVGITVCRLPYIKLALPSRSLACTSAGPFIQSFVQSL